MGQFWLHGKDCGRLKSHLEEKHGSDPRGVTGLIDNDSPNGNLIKRRGKEDIPFPVFKGLVCRAYWLNFLGHSKKLWKKMLSKFILPILWRKGFIDTDVHWHIIQVSPSKRVFMKIRLTWGLPCSRPCQAVTTPQAFSVPLCELVALSMWMPGVE